MYRFLSLDIMFITVTHVLHVMKADAFLLFSKIPLCK